MAGCKDYTDKADRAACQRWLNWNTQALRHLQRLIGLMPDGGVYLEAMQAEADRLVARIAELEG